MTDRRLFLLPVENKNSKHLSKGNLTAQGDLLACLKSTKKLGDAMAHSHRLFSFQISV